MTLAEHIKISRGVGTTIPIYEYDIEYMYDAVRESAKQLKDDIGYYEEYHESYARECAVIGMNKYGYKEKYIGEKINNAVVSVFMHHKEGGVMPWEYKDELVFYMCTSAGVPCVIHYDVSYAIVSKQEGVRYKTISIAFYNKKDELLVTLKQSKEQKYGEVRCKAGKYILSASAYKEKAKKDVGGGCLFCDSARYVKENGIVYIACSKYCGRVAEIEYSGEAYPEYCKRRV